MRATGAAAPRPPPSPRRMPARPPTRPTSPGGARRKDPRRRCRGEAVAPMEASWRSRGAILIPRLFFPGPVEAAYITVLPQQRDRPWRRRSNLPPVQAVLDEVVTVYRGVLGSRLAAVAVHGSAVTGDLFPGLSDVDFAVVLDSRLDLSDSVAIAAGLEAAEIAPFAYVQATYHEATIAVPSVVPGAFSVLHGDLDNGFLHTAESLRSAGGTWLQGLPRLANQDTKDWSVAVARRPRQFRLILTHLKPTVRALLVMWDDDPISTYSNPWPVLVDSLTVHEP